MRAVCCWCLERPRNTCLLAFEGSDAPPFGAPFGVVFYGFVDDVLDGFEDSGVWNRKEKTSEVPVNYGPFPGSVAAGGEAAKLF